MSEHATHAHVKELISHLDDELTKTLGEVGAELDAWSDGDQLRAFAYAQLHAQHNLMHVAELDTAHLKIPRALLRIAARLDLIDEAESQAELDDWWSTSEAAAAVGMSTQTVRRWCRTGMVRARKKGRDWLVDPTSIGAAE